MKPSCSCPEGLINGTQTEIYFTWLLHGQSKRRYLFSHVTITVRIIAQWLFLEISYKSFGCIFSDASEYGFKTYLARKISFLALFLSIFISQYFGREKLTHDDRSNSAP